MNYQAVFCWERGRKRGAYFSEEGNCPDHKRSGNGDSLLVQQVKTRRGRMLLAMVSDGIGGLEEGENASGFLAEELKRWFYGEALGIACRSYPEGRGLLRMEKSMARRLYNAAGTLRAYGKRESRKLGATLSAVLLWRRRYVICSVGDSRVCLAKRRGNRVLTRDDTDQRGCLTRCIGSFGWYPLRFSMGRLGRGQLLVLCTDGFWRKLRDGDLEAGRRVGGERDLEAWMEGMCRKLRNRGERDDITAVAIRIK